MDEIIKEIKGIGKWIDDCYKRSDLLDYHSLMQIGIESGNHIRKLIVYCIGLMTKEEHEKGESEFALHEAVIVGHLVRIYKLYDQEVFFVAENKGEISSIFNRMIFETYAIMKYLMINGKESIMSFIKSSFKSTMQNYRFIKEQGDHRELFNIEKRMIKKIENRIHLVNLSVDELLNNRNWKIDGRNFNDILAFLAQNDKKGFKWDLGYSFLFGSGSAFIHGTWYDIQINHLEEKNGKFYPKYSYDSVDPRYILPSSLIPVWACIDYLNWRKTDPDNFIGNVLKKMNDFLKYLNEMDEIRIDKRGGLIP
jgi:hypothetical protein